MDTDKYARAVVSMIQKKNKPIWFWQGGFSSLAWFLHYFIPRSMRLYIMARNFGMHLL